MVIKPSAAAEIERLVTTLLGQDEIEREGAAARLRVLGTRAVEHLLTALDRVSPGQQVVVLHVLESMADSRILGAALPRLADPETSAAALAVVRTHLAHADARRRAKALASLQAAALSPDLPIGQRAAVKVLLDGGTPAAEGGLAAPERPADVARASPRAATRPVSATGADRALVLLDPTALPTDPHVVRQGLAHAGSTLALSRLQDLVNVCREREHRSDASLALEWSGVRAIAHRLLAERGSRLALYDLRETLERWDDSWPVGFVAAVAAVGDATCVESVAAAYERSTSGWVQEQLLSAFRDILKREQLTRRHAAVKRAARRSPRLAALVWDI
ncbi:MAG: hypothetical protein U0Q12_27865 [Vicinamibacterales bacterium]